MGKNRILGLGKVKGGTEGQGFEVGVGKELEMKGRGEGGVTSL